MAMRRPATAVPESVRDWEVPSWRRADEPPLRTRSELHKLPLLSSKACHPDANLATNRRVRPRRASLRMPLLDELPNDVLARIVARLPAADDVGRVDQVSRTFRAIAELACWKRPAGRARARELAAARARAAHVEAPACGWTQQLLWEERREALFTRHRLAAGSRHFLMIDSLGRVRVRGDSEEEGTQFHAPGVLGHGAGGAGWLTARVPTPIPALASVRVLAIAAGARHNLCVAAGGAAFAFGCGSFGRLGHGDCKPRTTPARVEALGGHRVVGAAAGGSHTLLLTDEGAVFACGAGWWGRLGLGDTEHRGTPQRVRGLRAVRVVEVAAGEHHSLARCESGAVYSWGHGQHGKLGHGPAEHNHLEPRALPTFGRPLGAHAPVPPAGRALAISAGGAHSLVLAAGGCVFSFGDGRDGRLGHADDAARTVPTRVASLSRVRALAAGAAHSLALGQDGCVYSFGHGFIGALGHGDKRHRSAPARVRALAGACVEEIAAGANLSAAKTRAQPGAAANVDVDADEQPPGPSGAAGADGGGVARAGRHVFLWGIGGTERHLAVQRGTAEQLSPMPFELDW